MKRGICKPKCVVEKKDFYGENLWNHEMKCLKMFKDIEEGQILYLSVERTVSENELGQTYIEELSLEYTQYIRISLLTEEMIEYDLEMLRTEDREKLLNNYRPYFISFILSLENNDLKDIEFLREGWHIGRFTDSKEFDDKEEILLNGILEMSASPVNCIEGKLLVFKNKSISKLVLDKINSTYFTNDFVCTSSSEVENVLNQIWKKDFPNSIDIYNIGHGNADYIRGRRCRILFDIGYNYRSFPSYNNSQYLRAVDSIRKLKPSCVILSHWDLDHIIGCAYAKQNIFAQKWIAPHLISKKDKKPSTNSIRLARYLKVLGNLCLVDREQSNKMIANVACANDIEIRLWLGGGTSRISPKNREGLIFEIIDGNKKYPHILLAGDVPYQCIPNILNDKIDFLHVPHHCSKMELKRLISMPGNGECAIISTNRQKSGVVNYDNSHHQELNNKFKNVVNTIENKFNNDEANLSIQIDYKNGKFTIR